MRKILCLFAVTNVALALVYGSSEGPYTQSEGVVISTRDLVSSGSEDGFVITVALASFLISAAASLFHRAKTSTLLAVYTANHLLYFAFLFLAQLDHSLIASVRLGDWPLLLGLTVPIVLLLIYVAVYTIKYSKHRHA